MRIGRVAASCAAALGLVMAGTAGLAEAGKPNIPKGCQACHQAAPDTVRGKMGTVSEKFGTFQVEVGPVVWVVSFDGKLEVREGDKTSGSARIKDIPKDKEVLVSYTGGEGQPLATRIAVKQPYKVPEGQKITVKELETLIAKGTLTLVDARPPENYLDGHMPGAVSMPYPAFGKMHAKVLPAAKDALIAFYCAGPT